MSALWLEVNTWKSLIAISGEQVVKRNFKIEDDLTPKSFAPGVGNTPDMELYKNGYIIVPEVSLMTGVRQWEHEASSVIDHVLSFMNENKEKAEYDSLWDDDKKDPENPDPYEVADSKEIAMDAPEIVDVSEVMTPVQS